jgi:hypothetical protein
MRKKLNQDPWSQPQKDQEDFNDMNDSYTADFVRKSDKKATRREPICVLKVELDGNHTEKIQVFHGEDPEIIVQKFGNEFNLSANAKNRLLSQIT